MIQKEEGVKECIRNDHKGLQIVAVDLSWELNKEYDQKKYYCVKCLIEKIGIKRIVLYDEAKNKAKSVNEELKKNTFQKYQQTKDSFQKLSEVVKLTQGEYQTKFEDLKKQLDAQIINEQKKLQQVQESATTDDIKLLSSRYQEDGKIAISSPNIDYKEITEFLVEIKKIMYQFENFEQLQDVDKEIMTIEQTCSINLQLDENQKRTPASNLICESHKMEIIMFNLNQTEFEQTNPLLCVECAQNLLTRGNQAVANTISLKKAEEKWSEYIKEQSEKRLQRQSIFYQAIGFITKLQEKYNQEMNIMIQSFDDQLKKYPKEYEQLMKLNNTQLLKQDKQSLHEIIKILGSTDQSKKQEQIPNLEDQQFFDSQKKVLEELIKENLLIELQNHYV